MNRKGLLLYAPPDRRVPIERVKGIGEKWSRKLAESRFGISTVQELIQHYPRRHLDFSDQRTIREAPVGGEVTVIGQVRELNVPPPQRKRAPVRATLDDGTSKIQLVFFNQRWRAKQLSVGTTIAAKGKVTEYNKTRQMVSPMVDVIRESGDVAKIVPVYPATAELHTAKLRRMIAAALKEFSPLADPLPDDVVERAGSISRTEAMTSFHFPQEMSEKWRARKRLVFDELFTLQVGLAYRKHRIERDATGIEHPSGSSLAEAFLESLPFELTAAQQRSCKEISSDMSKAVPMHRLLQGEVGSGKTVVAVYAALIAVSAGYQVAIMAPTEVLATQHFLNITSLLESLEGEDYDTGRGQMGLFGTPEVVLLTGGLPAAKRREVQAKVADGTAGIVVGTHALIQESVDFATLGLAVIDEQHRFGVHQRMVLKEKSAGEVSPDVLIMTATPIPRTLTLTLYGDLDQSILDELPSGRKPVTTKVLSDAQREQAYDLVRSEVAKGRQAYVITPLVDESDKVEVRSAEAEAKRLATEVFPDLGVGMMHGRLRPKTKEEVMARFRSGEIDVLISTTVVEVGVDVPNASVMIVEGGDRFGLSQLHQLRGRIGRGVWDSTCLVFGSPKDPESLFDDPANERLQAFASTQDGFKLARKDLELRGAGTIMGTRQAGWSDLRLTNLLKDTGILKEARDAAFEIVGRDPDLSDHPLIRDEMEGRFADRLEWLFHS